MTARKFVKPKDGLLIREEFTGQHIPAEGCWVQRTTLVTKHLRVGDLVEAAPPAETAAEEPKPHKRERLVTPGTTGSEG